MQEILLGYAEPEGSIIRDPARGRVLVAGTAAPANATAGFGPGCIWINRAGTPGTCVYINVGTNASSYWINVEGNDVLPNFKYTPAGADATTFAAGSLTGALLTVYNSTATTPGTIATRTPAQMAADIGTAFYSTMSFVARIINSSASANTMTVTAGSGWTLSGTTAYTIAEFASRDFLFTFTSATAGTMIAIAGSGAATN